MINRDLKFVFVHIPKNAGTSVEYALFKTFKNEYNLYERAMKRVEKRMPNHKGLSFLGKGEFYRCFGARKSKTPQHRFLSEYNNVENYFSFAFVRNPWQRALSLYEYGKARRFYGDNITFAKFLREFPHPNWVDRYHDKKQFEYTRDVTFVGRVETLEKDFATILKVLKFPTIPIPKTNVTNREHYSYKYDDECVDLVGKLFFQDIDKFKYSFEDRR